MEYNTGNNFTKNIMSLIAYLITNYYYFIYLIPILGHKYIWVILYYQHYFI